MKHTFLVRLASFGFRAGTLIAVITGAAALTFGTPDTLKKALNDSGAYTSAADALVGQTSKSIGKQGASSAADIGPEKQTQLAITETAAKASFTPASLQATSEQNIDSLYAWLEGDTPKPDIRIDLQPYVSSFTKSLGDQATQRAASLPACTAEQLRAIDPNNVDILNLPCMPPGVNIAGAKDQAIAQAVASNEFLKNPVITTDSLPKDSQGKTAIDRAANVPQTFQWSMQAPWIFAGLALLCAAAILLLWRSDLREAIRKISRGLLGVGIVLLVIVAVARVLMWEVGKPDGVASKLVAGSYNEVLLAFVKTIERAYTGRLLVVGIAFVAIAILILVTLRITRPNAPAEVSVRQPAAAGGPGPISTPVPAPAPAPPMQPVKPNPPVTSPVNDETPLAPR